MIEFVFCRKPPSTASGMYTRALDSDILEGPCQISGIHLCQNSISDDACRAQAQIVRFVICHQEAEGVMAGWTAAYRLVWKAISHMAIESYLTMALPYVVYSTSSLDM
jgi:hypothetical protein